MHSRLPQAREFANSTAKLSILYRSASGIRTFEVSPAVAGAAAFALTLLLLAYGLAAGYYLYKDDLLRSALAGQARMQYAYEDRIAQLRAQIDRVASRQLIDQDSVESKLHELISRQVQLESRQALVARLSEDAAKAGIRPAPAAPALTGSIGSAPAPKAPVIAPMLTLPQRAKPLPDGVTTFAPQPIDELRGDRLSLHLPPQPRPPTMPVLLDQAHATSKALADHQLAVLRGIEASASASARRFKSVIDGVGLDRKRFARALQPARPQTGMGGPLVPISNAEAAAFERTLVAAQAHLSESQAYSRLLRTLPVRRPLGKEYETTSGFGPRVDPFTRGMAMHTGLDFRAATGTPIRATADGTVIEAGWSGGYGRMVEIDHGHGITTRYAHMSAIETAVGDTIRRGQVIGLVGSSGRSTGPHLHYEVRIDEDAADPLAFLRAGERGQAE